MKGANARRPRRVLFIAAVLAVLLGVLFFPQAFNLRLQPSPESAWFLLFLSTLSFLAIVILSLVLARQVLKLYAERRAHVLGAQFKTKLVIGALALSLTPVLCMFGFTYGLINRTLEKWFSQPVVDVANDNQNTLDLLAGYVQSNARHEALSIAGNPAIASAAAHANSAELRRNLSLHRATLEGGYALIVNREGTAQFAFDAPAGVRAGRGGQVQLGRTTYLLAHAPIAGAPPGWQVEVAMPLPAPLAAQIAHLAQDKDNYDRLARDRRSLRLLYFSYLLLLTVAVLFGATWMALYLSKMVTVPIGELAAATQEISRGNFAYRVAVSAQDEIGALVRSFNRMAAEIETNRAQIESARRYTETLLESTPSGVISLDRNYAIERMNPAVTRLFGAVPPAAHALEDLFDATSRREILHLLRKAQRWPSATGQIEVDAGGRALTLAATVAAIPRAGAGKRDFAGFVLVLEDLTDLLRIQKTAAWREVAQRIAHEIKNPLTPIALSAQRIRRWLEPPDLPRNGNVEPRQQAAPRALLAECAATIEAEVQSLQRLVDEFSRFARFPHARPVSCDLNQVIDAALRAFDGRLSGIEVRAELEALPALQLDPEEMKRVFVNLIDNAAEAMDASPYRQLTLATRLQEGTVEAVVADTGRGVAAADKQRLFLPYYSTKERGSGLGLAIVLRIVEENGGTLRVEDNTPLGARFIVELPVPADVLKARENAWPHPES